MVKATKELAAVLICDDNTIKHNVFGALAAITSEKLQVNHNSEYQSEKIPSLVTHENLIQVLKKANNYLNQCKNQICVNLITASSKTEAINKLKEVQSRVLTVGLIILDRSSIDANYNTENLLQLELDDFYSSLEKNGIQHFRSSYSDVVLISESQWHLNPYRNSIHFNIKCISDKTWVLQADILCYFLNYLQHIHGRPLFCQAFS